MGPSKVKTKHDKLNVNRGTRIVMPASTFYGSLNLLIWSVTNEIQTICPAWIDRFPPRGVYTVDVGERAAETRKLRRRGRRSFPRVYGPKPFYMWNVRAFCDQATRLAARKVVHTSSLLHYKQSPMKI